MTPQPQQQQEHRANRVVWFEIPAADLDRATRFYETVLGTPLNRTDFGGESMAILPYERPHVSGCITKMEGLKPNAEGVAIFLNADPSLDAALERVEPAGGKIVVPKTALPPGMGVYARIQDSEGNTVGLHAIS